MANEEHLAILQKGVKVWNLWRKENPEVRPDLSYEEFIAADFTNANLHSTNLRKVYFSQVNCRNANFRSTDLSGAAFSTVDFSGTDLQAVNLRYTKFVGADFVGSNLINADMSHADLVAAVFINIDLSEVKGLETVQHRGPSTIGIDTIYKSKGQIPEIFLRGCGVPDIFIEYMHALTAKPFEFYSCFISYSHADAAFAQRLHDTLQGKGVRCWLDEKDAKLGVPITHNIESGIRLTDKFLLCCSKESLSSGWVNYEIDLALHRETELRKQGGEVWRIIPLDLDGHLFSSEYSGEALRIRNRLAGDFTGWKTDSDKFDRQMARVMQAIRIEGGEK